MSFINEFREDRSKRLYQKGVNNDGDLMMIIEYNGYDDIIVEFQDDGACKVHTQYANFVRGIVKNYNKVKYGYHGYIGVGKYASEHRDENKNRILHHSYKVWSGMHNRAENYDGKHPSYSDVTVCEEWWNYQNFAEWYEKNYYEIEGDFLCLDKDIKDPYSRVYSPNTCMLVPDCINNIFKKMEDRPDGLPIGVHRRKDMKVERYRSRTVILDEKGNPKPVNSPSTETPEEAFEFYKKHKELYIKQMAEKHKNILTEEAYKILMEYEVVPYKKLELL